MKKIIAIAVSILVVATAVAAPKNTKMKYVDASTLTIINKVHNAGKPFARLDVERYKLTKSATNAFSQSTGLAVVFRTNSKNISAHWVTDARYMGTNSSATFQRGLDIFIRHNGEWVFAGVGRPKSNPRVGEHEFALVRRMDEGEKECMIYLPMFSRVESLSIGVDKDATIEALPSPFKHKIVFVGSSITHGASAGRPGASYVAALGRALNAETPNLGHSGQCKLQQHFVDIVCDTEADAFVFDTFSNSTDKIIDARLYDFVKDIRAKHKDTPLIFLQTIKRDIGFFDLGARKRNDDQRAAAERGMAKVMADFKGVYFLNPGLILGDDHAGTIDGTHLNDLGVYRTVQYLTPKIKKILKKHGIK